VHSIDEDRLEDWVDLFAEDCVYKILSRENFDSGLPLELMSCYGKAMLDDRILSLREANLYNIHWDRHILGGIEVLGIEEDNWLIKANYTLYQTTNKGDSELFSVGSYHDKIVSVDGVLKFKEKIVIVDTFAVIRLLSTPI